MILAPKNQETLSLALALENGMQQAENGNQEPLNISNLTVDRYIESIIRDFSNEENMISVVPVSKIHALSHTQLWALCYISVQNVLRAKEGRLNYTLLSAIETFREENPEFVTPERLTLVDLTNLVFQTEYDLVLAMNGFENVLDFLAQREKEINSEKSETEK
jgi:hypothetical protein